MKSRSSSSMRRERACIRRVLWGARNCPATTRCCAARFRSGVDCSIRCRELVKINPANIGVGMYQHDVKAKHLRNSLDAVVESCVNYVGVDVNTASPALLRYVSGMNQLTARRLCEYRSKHGPFRSRDQLKQVRDWAKRPLSRRPGSSRSPTATTRSMRPGFIRRATNWPARCWPRPAAVWRIWCDPPPPAPRPAPCDAWCRYRNRRPRRTAQTAAGRSTQRRSPADVRRRQWKWPSAARRRTRLPAAESPTAQHRRGRRAKRITPRRCRRVRSCRPSGAGGEGSSPSRTDCRWRSRRRRSRAATRRPTAVRRPRPMRSAREQVRQLDAPRLARELSVSELLLRDILNSLARPGRDPREDLPAPVFRRGDRQAGRSRSPA